MSPPRFDYGDYTIGWICALPKEMTAAMAMLDETHQDLPQPVSDHNNYGLGSMGKFNIAIASLPSGEIGSHLASAVATRMLATFPKLRIGLMVGIGDGVPSKENDIRLGDVVVSVPANGFGGVVQHDMGKNTNYGGWVRTGSLNGPPPVLRTTISKLMSLHQIRGHKIESYISEMIQHHPHLHPRYTRQENSTDVLYEPEPEDPNAFWGWIQVERAPRQPHETIQIHYGLIASGNQVIKSGRLRDQISSRYGGVLCVEMEAAGLMNELPCVVIRGICDYADAHKNKRWQEYAAAVAAAYAKELITALPVAVPERLAFRGLQAIVLDIQDQDLLATESEPVWVVPFARNKHFVGREQELATLREWSASEDSCHKMAVFGLGGVGKTQLALEFAYRTKERNPKCSVFWVPAIDNLAFEQAYMQIGRNCNVPGIDAKEADVKQLVKDALSDKRIGPWLMIIDNADDSVMVFRQSTEGELFALTLADYLPSSPYGSVFFTTRNRKVAVKQAASNIICLEMMGPDEAQDLLKRSLIRQDILSNVAAAMELLDLLGFLPLAIIQAAAYINENDTTIDEYTSMYDDNETEVLKVLSEDFDVQGRYDAAKNSIATTWLISLSQINRTNPTAIEFLSFMACMNNQNIHQPLLPPVPSKKKSLEAIGALKSYSFIKKREDSSGFDMHRLVHLAMRNWLRSEGKLQIWVDKAIVRLAELLPAGGHKDRETWTAYVPHANYLLATAGDAEADLNIVILAEKLGQCLYSNGEYHEAQKAFERALELRIKVSGLENRNALRSMFGLAEALDHQGKHKLAECQHREILELRKKVLGPKDPEVGRSMNYLAQAMYEGGNYAEAEKWHREALALQNEVLHSEHSNTLTTTRYLAQTLGKQGKYEEAEEMHRNLLKTRLRVQGEQYPGTLATMSCLGVAQGDLGNYADAEQTHRRVLNLRLKVLGSRHPHTLITQRWLADALLRQAKYEEAYALNRDTLKVQVESLGPKHPNTVLTLGNLGDILFFQEKADRAEQVYRQVLAVQSEVLGPEHPETLETMNGTSKAAGETGRGESIVSKDVGVSSEGFGGQNIQRHWGLSDAF